MRSLWGCSSLSWESSALRLDQIERNQSKGLPLRSFLSYEHHVLVSLLALVAGHLSHCPCHLCGRQPETLDTTHPGMPVECRPAGHYCVSNGLWRVVSFGQPEKVSPQLNIHMASLLLSLSSVVLLTVPILLVLPMRMGFTTSFPRLRKMKFANTFCWINWRITHRYAIRRTLDEVMRYGTCSDVLNLL